MKIESLAMQPCCQDRLHLLEPAVSTDTEEASSFVQTVVEQQLAREGSSRQEVGREALTERVWACFFQL